MFETCIKLCRGCLSADRKCISVSSGDLNLYYNLLVEDRQLDMLTKTDLDLCWECVALLRRMQKFRTQVQRAHTILEECLGLPPAKSTLSTLTLQHKLEYDAVYEETRPSDPDVTVDKILIPTKYKAQITNTDLVNTRDKDASNNNDFEDNNMSDDSDHYETFGMSDASLEMPIKDVTPSIKKQDGERNKNLKLVSIKPENKVAKSQWKPEVINQVVKNKKYCPIVKTPVIAKLEVELQKFIQNEEKRTKIQRKLTRKTEKKSTGIDTKSGSSNNIAEVKHAVIARDNEDDSGSSADDDASNDDALDGDAKQPKKNADPDPDFRLGEDEDIDSDDSRIGRTEDVPKNKLDDGTPNQIRKRYEKKIIRHKHVDDVLSWFTEIEMSVEELKSVLEKEDAIVDEKKPYKCNVCGQLFSFSRTLSYHASCYHKATHRAQFRKGNFYNPPPTIPEKSLWRCSICSRMLRKEHTVAHVNELHRTQYSCCGEECEWSAKVFGTRAEFEQHWAAVHKQFICDHCNARKLNKSFLEHHIMEKHLRLAMHKCPHCRYRAATAGLLARHLPRHAPVPAERRYCVECDVTFKSLARLQQHFSVKHRARPQKKYPCGECGRVLSSKNSYRNHYGLLHAGKTDHCCHVCGKYLSKAQSLESHLKSHQNIKMEKTKPCHICGRKFQTNRTLRQHVYTHTGERPYACTHCAAAFTQPHCLRVHLAKRHGVNRVVKYGAPYNTAEAAADELTAHVTTP